MALRRTAWTALPLAAGLLLLGGCQTPTTSTRPDAASQRRAPEPRRDMSMLVLPTDGMLAWERTAPDPTMRFEYARLDERLTPRTRQPLRATDQWPEIPGPPERRVRFWYWWQR